MSGAGTIVQSVREVPTQFKEAYHAAMEAGWVLRYNSANHIIWCPPDGGHAPVLPGTEVRAKRTVKNYIAELRRAGLAIPTGRAAPKKGRPRAA